MACAVKDVNVYVCYDPTRVTENKQCETGKQTKNHILQITYQSLSKQIQS